jgi:electron transfer flavoprotein beta subunit
MNIIVCVKAVPNPALPLEFDVWNNTIKDTGWNYILNRYDEVALEEALRLREAHGGKVTVVTLAPALNDEVLRTCLAMGVDHAIRIDSPDSFQFDGYNIARRLSETIGQKEYDIILCGYRSLDRNAGEVGSMLAELLGLPSVTAIVDLKVDSSTQTARVVRRLERGAREIKQCRLPALFTTDLLLNEPRYPTLPGRKLAARYDIEIVQQVTMSSESQTSRVTAVTKPPPKKIFIPTGTLSPAERIRMLTQGSVARKSSQGNMLEGNPDDIARKTLDFLKSKRLLP